MGSILRWAGSAVSAALSQEALPVALSCFCGRATDVPKALVGNRGRCEECNRPLRVPGERRGERSFEQPHAMQEVKMVAMEPCIAPLNPAFRAALLHGCIPGVFHVLPWIAFAAGAEGLRDGALAGVGWTPDSPLWLVRLWILAVFLACSSCSLPIAREYARVAGVAYPEDRLGFARAAGFDLVRWVPVLVYGSIFGALSTWRGAREVGLLDGLRDPWVFLAFGAGASLLVAGASARYVFRARFGRGQGRN